MCQVMRKPDFFLCENKGADQLRSNCEADRCLCFHYKDSTIPLLPISEISSFKPSSVSAHDGLCQTWSETPKSGFLASRLKYPSSTIVCICNVTSLSQIWLLLLLLLSSISVVILVILQYLRFILNKVFSPLNYKKKKNTCNNK